MLALFLSLFATSAVPIHTRLERSEPAAQAVVASSPDALRLWFEGGVEAQFTRVTLHAARGARLALGAPAAGATPGLVVVPVPLRLPAGEYTVSWETAGRDGHVITGTFRFTVAGTAPVGPTLDSLAGDSTAWGAGSAGRTVAGRPPVAAMPRAPTSVTVAYSPAARAVRWLELATLVVALGAVVMLVLVLRTGPGSPAHEQFLQDAVRRVRQLGALTSGAYLAATGMRFALESDFLHGAGGGMAPSALAATAGTAWGRAWLVSAVAMLVVFIAFVVHWLRTGAAPGRASRRTTDLALCLGALVTAVGPAMTGHAAASPAWMPGAVLADWLHVVGASVWVGGVAALAVSAAPAALAQPHGARTPALAWLVAAFHALATPGIALVVTSGLVSTWLRVGSWTALVTSNYGDLLLFKVYLVAFTALLGGYHWKRVYPRLAAAGAGDERTARRLGWTLRVELAVGLLVVALTAALVTTAPPR